mmetsp:Transcript_22556/g.27575  ORF Transcript_22556/g.27575 Transcript_22556/m.27575 type:complete len:91 (-) Transcript_22556:770-1042(-)
MIFFDLVKRDKAVAEFYNKQDVLKQKSKTKNDQFFEEAKQILDCTPLINVIPLSVCDVKGHAIKTDSNKWTIYLQDLSDPKVRMSEQILC